MLAVVQAKKDLSGTLLTSLEILLKRLEPIAANRGALAKLAEASGIPLSNLSRYASGKATPKLPQVDKIAEALGLTTPEFLTDPDNPTPISPREKKLVEALELSEKAFEALKAAGISHINVKD